MKLAFSLDTHGTCVGQLIDELLPLEELAKEGHFHETKARDRGAGDGDR